MLKKLRKKKTAKRIWIILIILILPAFLFWGFGTYIRSRQEGYYLGRVFGKKITSLEYKDALDAVRNQALIQFGDNFEEIEKNLNLEGQAWERLLLLAEAKKRRITASDNEVVELITSYPFLQSKGKFSQRIYSQMLEYVFRTQPRIFEEQTRQNLILSKLYKIVTEKINVTEENIWEEYIKLNEQIDLYYIVSAPSEFIKDIVPQDEEIKNYFEKNSLQFKQPLSFNIEYISLTSEGKDKEQEAMENKIKKLILRLNARESFAEVAKDFNLEVKETGFFSQTDSIPGIGWSPQILNLIAKLKIGQFSPPIHMDRHYYILRLKQKRESYIPDLETIKDKVKERFIKDRSTEMAKEKIEDCLKKLKELSKDKPKAIDFDKLAKSQGLKLGSTNLFKYGSYIEGIGVSDSFFTAARDLKENEFSQIITMPSGFYIVKLKKRLPIDEKKFAEEKDEFAKRLLLQKRIEYFSKFLEELKRNVQIF